MTGPRVQRLVIGVAAAVMLVAGAGLAWAAGLNGSARASVPVVVSSNRPLYAQAETTATAQPVPVTAKAPSQKKSAPVVTVTKKTNRSSSTTTKVTTVKKSSGKKRSTAKTHDGHETVKPPVRDEDDEDHEESKPKSSDSRNH